MSSLNSIGQEPSYSASKIAVSISIVGVSAVSGVAGGVIIALGALNTFGAVGSIGFIAAMAGGGALEAGFGIGVITVIIIAITDLKTSKDPETSESESHSNLLDVESTSEEEKASSTTAHKKKKKGTKTSNLTLEKRQYRQARQKFYAAAQNCLEEKEFPISSLPDSKEDDFIENAAEATRCFFFAPKNDSIRQFGGGCHLCVATDKIPGVLFKKPRGDFPKGELEGYINQAAEGRGICEKYNLDLLYVPLCEKLDDPKYVILEEMVELLGGDGDWETQRTNFQWAINDPKLRPYIKKVLEQLTIYICRTGFSDVKYDNIALMNDGRIALFDIDQRNAITGLTRGSARGADGLFNILPLKWFDDFVEIVEAHLPEDEFKAFQDELPALMDAAKERENHAQEMAAFYKKRKIILPKQPLVVKNKSKKLLGREIVKQLNKKIAQLGYLDLSAGRNIQIDINIGNELYSAVKSKYPSYQKFKADLPLILESLKQNGVLFSYEISRYYPKFSVIC